MDILDRQFEQATASPCVIQFMTDYLFIQGKLKTEGINPTMDVGMGDADLALSIVNDAYNHERMTKIAEKIKAEPELIPWEVAQKESGLDG